MKNKKHQQFIALYESVHARFEKYCLANAYGDMPHKDLLNESLLVAYQKFDTIENKNSFLSYLIGIARRLLSNANKKKKAEAMTDEVLLMTGSEEKEIEKKFEIDFLYESLAKLPEKQREALVLFELTGFSIKEIMEIQKSGESAVKQRLARARKSLAEIIQSANSYKKNS